MPASIAFIVYLLLLIGLLRYDPARDSATSRALWVPVAWMGILVSRLPSQWLGTTADSAAQAMEEGNWLDRAVYLVLILFAVRILTKRSISLGTLLVNNYALVSLLVFALFSAAWSDFPDISVKRWGRDLGNYLIVLVVLTDLSPLAAIETVIRRVCYIFVPLSVVLIKYFPGNGVGWDGWTGMPLYVGATTGKNALGLLCLLSGLLFGWDTVRRWPQRAAKRTRRTILVNLAFLGMTLWLLNLSKSVTSQTCLLIGFAVIVAIHTRMIDTRSLWLRVATPAAIALYLALDFSFGITQGFTEALGRDSTMTGRTDLWEAVLPLNPNALLGAGYESFWLGGRLARLWYTFWWQPNQAHNGYLEVYLNLGLLGLCIVGIFLLVSYWRIWRPTDAADLLSLRLAIWIIVILYNVTEATVFKGTLWVMLLLASVVVPRPAAALVQSEKAPARRRPWRATANNPTPEAY